MVVSLLCVRRGPSPPLLITVSAILLKIKNPIKRKITPFQAVFRQLQAMSDYFLTGTIKFEHYRNKQGQHKNGFNGLIKKISHTRPPGKNPHQYIYCTSPPKLTKIVTKKIPTVSQHLTKFGKPDKIWQRRQKLSHHAFNMSKLGNIRLL